MDDHELRKKAVAEMHLRRWPAIPVPCLIVQWVLMIEEAAEITELEAITAHAAEIHPVENPSHRSGNLTDRIRFSWEQHSEGSSLTLLVPRADAEAFLDPDADEELRTTLDWVRRLPGKIVRATRIWIAPSDSDAEQLLERMDLQRDELVCGLIDGSIRIWSDFRLREDGFGRLVVAANGAETGDLTRAVQRLQELGNYRNRALLGLPVARECWPRLDAAERRLRDLADRVADSDERDDELMEALSDLSLDLAGISTAIGFRMDASKAYSQLVEARLLQLKAEPVPGFASLDDFTQRRFRPAMNTCTATTERVRELAVRAEQLSSLLRARIDTRIENQNAKLLHSMERSIAMQVRLQQLVEGLSVVALSYYLIGLLRFFFEGLPPERLPLPIEAIVGALVIPVVLGVWLIMRLLKRRALSNGTP
jgi:uncharacterized membrane-anchored protein